MPLSLPLRPSLWRSLRHRNYRLYLTGQLVSVCGTWMQQVALSWLVYRLTGSATLLGVVGFASQIPVLALGALVQAMALMKKVIGWAYFRRSSSRAFCTC